MSDWGYAVGEAAPSSWILSYILWSSNLCVAWHYCVANTMFPPSLASYWQSGPSAWSKFLCNSQSWKFSLVLRNPREWLPFSPRRWCTSLCKLMYTMLMSASWTSSLGSVNDVMPLTTIWTPAPSGDTTSGHQWRCSLRIPHLCTCSTNPDWHPASGRFAPVWASVEPTWNTLCCTLGMTTLFPVHWKLCMHLIHRHLLISAD